MEIASEIEKVKHGHGKRETSETSEQPRLPPLGAQEASQVRRRVHSHDMPARTYVREHLSTYVAARRGPGNSVPVLPVHGRHGNLFNVSGTPSYLARTYARARTFSQDISMYKFLGKRGISGIVVA